MDKINEFQLLINDAQKLFDEFSEELKNEYDVHEAATLTDIDHYLKILQISTRHLRYYFKDI